METKNKMRRITAGTIIGIFFAGMAFGYIAGLWQQIAQKRHRLTCESCRQYSEAIRDCDR